LYCVLKKKKESDSKKIFFSTWLVGWTKWIESSPNRLSGGPSTHVYVIPAAVLRMTAKDRPVFFFLFSAHISPNH
jgi:hypothetical protein